MGFCTPDEYRRFLHQCPIFERLLVEDGDPAASSTGSRSSDEEQERRFQLAARRPDAQLEALADGPRVACALGRLLAGQGRDVRPHRHPRGAVVRGRERRQAHARGSTASPTCSRSIPYEDVIETPLELPPRPGRRRLRAPAAVALPLRAGPRGGLARRGSRAGARRCARLGAGVRPQRVRERFMATDAAGTPVVFVHGLWLHADSWGAWVDLFREHGYAPVAPGWPGDGDTVEDTRANPDARRRLRHRRRRRPLRRDHRRPAREADRDRPLVRRADRPAAARPEPRVRRRSRSTRRRSRASSTCRRRRSASPRSRCATRATATRRSR